MVSASHLPCRQDENLLMRLYALNEADSKLSGGIDWRQKLESQRGAVLATELKNNSNKLAKWTIQASAPLLLGRMPALLEIGRTLRRTSSPSRHEPLAEPWSKAQGHTFRRPCLLVPI